MLILIVGFLVVLAVLGIVWQNNPKSETDVGGWTAFCSIVLLIVVGVIYGIGCFKWNPNDKLLTGYIYQRQEKYGYANYSLRFSQNAGMDAQPGFCVEAGSQADEDIGRFVGTDTKVQISVPARGAGFGGFWECDSSAKLDRVIKEE